MIIKIEKEKPLLPEGSHSAVVAGVYSIGLHPGFQGEQPKRKHVILFELDEIIPEGKYTGQPYIVSNMYNDNLNEKSRLVEVVRALKGGLTSQETQSGFDPESLCGAKCTIVTVNKTNGCKTSTSIVSVLRRDNSLPPLVPTFDRTKVPAWVQRLQSQRLDK